MKKILCIVVTLMAVVFCLAFSAQATTKKGMELANAILNDKPTANTNYTGQPAITPVQVSSPYRLTEEDILKVKTAAKTAAKDELKNELYGSGKKQGVITKLRNEFNNLFAKKTDLENLDGKVNENQVAIQNINGKLVVLEKATADNKITAEKAQRKAEGASDTADNAWTLALIALLFSVGIVICIVISMFREEISSFLKGVVGYFKRAKAAKSPTT